MIKKIIFGAGCFWGVQQVFDAVNGVISTTAGYSGGDYKNPHYKDVCSGMTGHAEVLLIEYDEEKITFADLLGIFWKSHNPTTLNKQGHDVGNQYRSVIFFFDELQKVAAEKSKNDMESSLKYNEPIVTEILPAGPFYEAEDYHQKYYAKNDFKGCHL